MMAKEKRRYFSLRRRDEAFAYHQNHFCSRAQAEDSGYAFTSMTYVFAGKAKKIKLRAEFKRNPKIFEVCLENYMEPAIGEKEKYEDAMSSLDEADNIAIRSVFWNNAKKVYKSIQDERLKSQTMVTSRKK